MAPTGLFGIRFAFARGMTISSQLAQARFDYFRSEKLAGGSAPESLGKIGGEVADSNSKSPSFHDVLAAINPLNHLPIVSDLFASANTEKSSPLSNAIGVVSSTLLGGPVGLIASLASMVFESATGQSPVQALAHAVTGGPQTVASNDIPAEATKKLAQNTSAEREQSLAALAPATGTASASVDGGKRQAILDLYGASPASAHASYRSAQLRPYLNDVTVSRVL